MKLLMLGIAESCEEIAESNEKATNRPWLCKKALFHGILAAVILALLRGIG
jgi:hypothetical protein